MRKQENPNYRVEHVAETPRGWRVRTKMQSTHVLRIAFPPGPRRKGTGKVVEILHPVNENPCVLKNADADDRQLLDLWRLARTAGHESRHERLQFVAKEWAKTHGGRTAAYKRIDSLTRGYGHNPASETEQGEHLYRDFHGKDAKKILAMQESDVSRRTFTALGDLSELIIHAPAGTVKIGFSSHDAVKVASSPAGTQLYLIGGNQNIDSALEKFGSDRTKDFVELGEGKQITYSARKAFDAFKLVDYYHNLGEETGDRPILFYDRLKKRIFFVGGAYRVEAPGIIN